MDKSTMIESIKVDFARLHQQSLDISKTIKEREVDALLYMKELLTRMNASDSVGGALLAKTPKIPRKRGTRIKAIPENDEMEDGSFSMSHSNRSSKVPSALEISDVRPTRAKRGASVKAADIIKKQQSITLTTKLRRPSNEGSDIPLSNRISKESRSKRPKESVASSEDEDVRPIKQSRIEKSTSKLKQKINDETHMIMNDTVPVADKTQTIQIDKKNQSSIKRKLDDHIDDDLVDTTLVSERSRRQSSMSNCEPVTKKANYSKISPLKSEKDSKYVSTLKKISEKTINSNENDKLEARITRSSSLINAQSSKKYKMTNIINETMDADETIASMYEDAIGKPIPIMNSTMNPNTTITIERLPNLTVVIEPLSTKKIFNETVIIKKSSFKESHLQNDSNVKETEEKRKSKSKSTMKKATKVEPSGNVKVSKFNELITDDESSPERKEYRTKKEKIPQQKRVTRSNNSLISDDEVQQTPIRVQNKGTAAKSAYKQSALFSPYAKESVKKRVAAFEQAAGSPKPGEEETAGRVTRTKTRALAAANHSEIPVPSVTQKLARKSLAKAKKISLAKHIKEYDDVKENEDTNIPKSIKKNSESLDRGIQKSQLKTTPMGKSRMLQLPNSVSKTQFATPSNTNNINPYSKALTGPRGNVVTHVDSFIQPMKSAQKTIDRAAEEKRRRAHEEDARRKREELLKAKAEEKRRKREEKELKNKLAREAKEKLEHEKRQKAEREREEKAKLAQLVQEKQREEIEKKRFAQMQRAQEKEERRRQEEQLRLQRLQEQEEQERQLAEQKRREQEMEKRKQAELKHMAEMKMKSQIEKAQMQAKSKAATQKLMPYNYKIDSDPDEEESDDESKPKHQIAHWASRHVRQAQLAMQQHVPMGAVLKFFGAKKSTPDLRDLFQGIDPKKLKRSSSAVWKTPPRYSMMNCSIIKD